MGSVTYLLAKTRTYVEFDYLSAGLMKKDSNNHLLPKVKQHYTPNTAMGWRGRIKSHKSGYVLAKDDSQYLWGTNMPVEGELVIGRWLSDGAKNRKTYNKVEKPQ